MTETLFHQTKNIQYFDGIENHVSTINKVLLYKNVKVVEIDAVDFSLEIMLPFPIDAANYYLELINNLRKGIAVWMTESEPDYEIEYADGDVYNSNTHDFKFFKTYLEKKG